MRNIISLGDLPGAEGVGPGRGGDEGRAHEALSLLEDCLLAAGSLTCYWIVYSLLDVSGANGATKEASEAREQASVEVWR